MLSGDCGAANQRKEGDPMLPMRLIRLLIGSLLATDADSLAPAALGNKVALIKAAFSPDENMEVGDLVLADFDGSTPLVAGPGDQQVGNDPATGDQIITILEPAGGWRWITSGSTHLP